MQSPVYNLTLKMQFVSNKNKKIYANPLYNSPTPIITVQLKNNNQHLQQTTATNFSNKLLQQRSENIEALKGRHSIAVAQAPWREAHGNKAT